MSNKKGKEKNEKVEKALNKLIQKTLPRVSLFFFIITLIIYFFVPKQWGIYDKLINLGSFLREDLFIETKSEMLMTISVVLISFYVTVMSVFGASISNAVLEISKNELSDDFMSYAIEAIISTFTHFIVTIFFDVIKGEYFIYIYTSILLWVIFNFMRFSAVVLKMYENNIINASKISKQERNERKELMKILIQIKDSQELERVRHDNSHLEDMIDISEKHRKEAKDLPYKET